LRQQPVEVALGGVRRRRRDDDGTEVFQRVERVGV
jgi:hypothetical protein